MVAGFLEYKYGPGQSPIAAVCVTSPIPSRRTGKAAFDRTMKMPAEDPLDLGVTPNNLCETGAPGEPCLVHPADTGRKRRMVYEY